MPRPSPIFKKGACVVAAATLKATHSSPALTKGQRGHVIGQYTKYMDMDWRDPEAYVYRVHFDQPDGSYVSTMLDGTFLKSCRGLRPLRRQIPIE